MSKLVAMIGIVVCFVVMTASVASAQHPKTVKAPVVPSYLDRHK